MNQGENHEASGSTDLPKASTSLGNILVVDDDAGMRGVVAAILLHTGYRVSCAEDGEAGWSALCGDRFDMMITDHEMPRLRGLDLLRRVRRAPLNVPVILTSATIPWHEPDLLPLLPPGQVLEKPFSPAKLLSTVRRFLTPMIRVNG
jgi:DNA-binding response OmpR family regulator